MMILTETKLLKGSQDFTELWASLVLILTAGVPAESLLVELDHHLRTLHVGLPGRHQVGLVTSLPLDEEHQLPRAVCGSDNPLRLQTSVKPCQDG